MSVESAKQALQQRDETKTFPGLLKKFAPEIERALPEHLKKNIDRYTRLALTEFNRNDKLGKCDPRSIFASVIIAGQLGLEIGVLGQAYLVPYGGYAQLVPGWKGFVSLVHRTGNAVVWTGIIYKDQKYEYRDGSQKYLRILNESNLMEDEDITHSFSVGVIKGMESTPIIELWPIEKIKRHRDRFNKVGKSHYSYSNFEMYARKVPLLQVVKYLPASVELSDAVSLGHAADTGDRPQGLTIDAIQEGLFTPNPDNKNTPESPQTAKTEAPIEVKTEPAATAKTRTEAKTAPAKSTKVVEPKKQEQAAPWDADSNSPENESPTDIEGDPKPDVKAKAAAAPITDSREGQKKRGIVFPYIMTVQDGVGEPYTKEQLEKAEDLCKIIGLPSADAAIEKWLREEGGKGKPVKRENMTFQAMAKFIELLEVVIPKK